MRNISKSASSANEAVRALGRLHSRLEHTAVDEIMEEGLERYLQDVQRRITGYEQQITGLRDARDAVTGDFGPSLGYPPNDDLCRSRDLEADVATPN